MGAIAQLVERMDGIHEVTGSTPVGSTKNVAISLRKSSEVCALNIFSIFNCGLILLFCSINFGGIVCAGACGSGFLIALEGIDGTGKSTLCKALAKYFQTKNQQVLSVREPGGSQLGKKIRTLLLEEQSIKIFPETEMLLFAADRAQLFREHVIPALTQGFVVISDRSSLSSLIYQGYGKGLDKDVIRSINAWAYNDIKPNLIVLLDLDVQIAKKRIANSRATLDSFEKREDVFFEVLRRGFKEEVKDNPNALILDAAESTENLCQKIIKKIESLNRPS